MNPDELAVLIETVAALIGEIGSRGKSTAAVNACLAHARQQFAKELAAAKESAEYAWKNTRILDAARQEQDEELAELRAQVEGMRKDAERYRWLRNPDSDLDALAERTWMKDPEQQVWSGQKFDEAIDAAIAQEPGK